MRSGARLPVRPVHHALVPVDSEADVPSSGVSRWLPHGMRWGTSSFVSNRSSHPINAEARRPSSSPAIAAGYASIHGVHCGGDASRAPARAPGRRPRATGERDPARVGARSSRRSSHQRSCCVGLNYRAAHRRAARPSFRSAGARPPSRCSVLKPPSARARAPASDPLPGRRHAPRSRGGARRS